MTNFVMFRDIYRQFDMSVDNTDTNNHDNLFALQYSYTKLQYCPSLLSYYIVLGVTLTKGILRAILIGELFYQ